MKQRGNIAIFVPHAGCEHSCSFCNQRTISGKSEPPTKKQVEETLQSATDIMGGQCSKSEVAFFGGSFTAIPREYMLELLLAAQPFLGGNGFSGIRISTRPDCIDEEILAVLKKHNVTAIELGAQSMDDRVLNINDRGHTALHTQKACSLIREHGFSLGLQMMTGLYGDTRELSIQTAQIIADIKPDTVRIYPTLVLKGTKLEQLFLEGKYTPCTLQQQIGLCSQLLEIFANVGVNVIRMGLHDSEQLASGALAGAHHPAFRELCEGDILLKKVLEQIVQKNIPKGNILVQVKTGSLSKMIGQHRCNITTLKQNGYTIKVEENPQLKYLEVAVLNCDT